MNSSNKQENSNDKKKIILKLTSEPLYKQRLFQLAIIIPIILFFIFEIPLMMSANFSFTIPAFKYFVESSTLAFLLLSLCIPSVAIVMYMHRTVQTHEQISLTQTQINNVNIQLKLIQDKNNADLYFSHNKYISDIILSLPKYKTKFLNSKGEPEVFESGIMSASHIYTQVYKNFDPKSEFNIDVNSNFPQRIRNLFGHINSYISKAKYANENKTFDYPVMGGMPKVKVIGEEKKNEILLSTLQGIYSVIISLKRDLAINEFPYFRLYVASIGNLKVAYPYSSELDLIDDINGIRLVCINLLKSLGFGMMEPGILQAGRHLGDPITLFLQKEEGYKNIFSTILTSEVAPISAKVFDEIPNHEIKPDPNFMTQHL
ncbi:TPA: hypothetical protein ACKRMM_005936 [Pseudomonas aeruginosa]